MREFPVLSPLPTNKFRPLSFVVVRFSDDYLHNIAKSPCVQDPRNQLITIDNTANLFFDNLSQALNAGMSRAIHDIVVTVHEDVYLLPEWQAHFTRALESLEVRDPNWGVVGSVGWAADESMVGHWSDPHTYANTLRDQSFQEVVSIDEQIMVLRKTGGVNFDDELPSIHNIGKDVPLSAKALGKRTYVVNAPTIHKLADSMGRMIQKREDSPKIMNRTSLTYGADKDCSDEYFHRKWLTDSVTQHVVNESAAAAECLDGPLILVSRGGSGSRLLTVLGRDLGVFLGNDLNASGDSMEMVTPIYKAVIEKYRCVAQWQRDAIVPQLRRAAGSMIEHLPSGTLWGFKVPESILLLREFCEAFPGARYLHLIRDPLTTCLRRTHMTARLDNEIGRVTLREAYKHLRIPIHKIETNSPALHMANTTRHQLEIALTETAKLSARQHMEIRFEQLLTDPEGTLETCAQWLQVPVANSQLISSVDGARANNPAIPYSESVVKEVRKALLPLRLRLGYLRWNGAIERWRLMK